MSTVSVGASRVYPSIESIESHPHYERAMERLAADVEAAPAYPRLSPVALPDELTPAAAALAEQVEAFASDLAYAEAEEELLRGVEKDLAAVLAQGAEANRELAKAVRDLAIDAGADFDLPLSHEEQAERIANKICDDDTLRDEIYSWLLQPGDPAKLLGIFKVVHAEARRLHWL